MLHFSGNGQGEGHVAATVRGRQGEKEKENEISFAEVQSEFYADKSTCLNFYPSFWRPRPKLQINVESFLYSSFDESLSRKKWMNVLGKEKSESW